MEKRFLAFMAMTFLLVIILASFVLGQISSPSPSPTASSSYIQLAPDAVIEYTNPYTGEVVDLSSMQTANGYSDEIAGYIYSGNNFVSILPSNDKSRFDIDDNRETSAYIIEFKDKSLLEKRKELLPDLKYKPSPKDTISQELDIYRESLKLAHENSKQRVLNAVNSLRYTRNERPVFSVIRDFSIVFNAIVFELTLEEVEEVKKLADVRAVYPRVKVRALLDESVGLIGADKALWPLVTGKGVTIGIIDTGIDYTHENFGSCKREEFLGGKCGKVMGGYDFVNDDNDPYDDNSHGTHVAGIVAGNGPKVKGVAPDAKLYALKVLDSSSHGSSDDIVAGIERSFDLDGDGYIYGIDPEEDNIDDTLDVISLSLGGNGNPDDLMSLAVDRAIDNGVVAVVAAGNCGPQGSTFGRCSKLGDKTIHSPGTSRKAITVGSVDKALKISGSSSRGPVEWKGEIITKPDVVAPGVNILSSIPGILQESNSYKEYSGTSMATPHVSGLAALLLEAYSWSPQEIKDMLMSTASDLGYDANTQGKGLVSASAALEKIGTNYLESIVLPYNEIIRADPIKKEIEIKQSYRIINLKSTELKYNLKAETPNGITSSFSQINFNIPGKGEAYFDLNLKINSDIISSNPKEGRIIFSSQSKTFAVPFIVNLNHRLIHPEEIDLGIFLPSVSLWEKKFSVQLTNMRTDASQVYNVRIESKEYKDINGKISRERDLSNNFILSINTLNFAPGETKTLDVSVSIKNENLPNGFYYGKIILESGLDSIEIPFSFFKYYKLQLNFVNNPLIDLKYSCFKDDNGNNCFDIVKEDSMVFYFDEPKHRDLILGGYQRVGSIDYFVDYIKEMMVDGYNSFNVDFNEADNNLETELMDKDGKEINSLSTIISLENEFGVISEQTYRNFYKRLRKFTDLPDNYKYRYIIDNSYYPTYIASGVVNGPKSSFKIGSKPEEYKDLKVTYHTKSKQFRPVYSIRIQNLEFSQPLGDVKSGETKIFSLRDSNSITEGYFSTKVDDGSNKEVIESPLFEVVNGKLRKSTLLTNIFHGKFIFMPETLPAALLEETDNFDVHLGLGPEFWMGRLKVTPVTERGFEGYNELEVLTKQQNRNFVQWYFMTQGFDKIPHEDMPYSLYLNDELIKTGKLYGGKLDAYYSTDSIYLSSIENGRFIFYLKRDYAIGLDRYNGEVKAEFDTLAEEKSPPALDMLKITCNDVPCERLSRSTMNKIVLSADPVGGKLDIVKLYYSLGSKTGEIPLSLSDGKYLAILPVFDSGVVDLKIYLEDDSGNNLEYKFSLPSFYKTNFMRGDSDDNGKVDLVDAIFVLDYLFRDGKIPACLKASDANDDGLVNLGDAIKILTVLFSSGQMPIPYPDAGPDVTEDKLSC